jgi:hypothetical protein
MNSKGYAFDYVSDLQINGIQAVENNLNTGGVSYRTLVLPECKYIPVETFSRIISLADNGATIIFYGNMPEDISGWNHLDQKRGIYKSLKEQLKFTKAAVNDIMEAQTGKGKILMGNNLEQLLAYSKIRREPMTDAGLKFTRRKMKDGNCYFILNQSDKQFDGWLSLGVRGNSAAIFNPIDETKGMGKVRTTNDGNLEVYLKLSPSQSTVIRTSANKVSGSPYDYYVPSGNPVELAGTWSVRFTTGGPELPPVKEITRLVSWTEFGGEPYKNFSGTAEYSIKLKQPSGEAEAWILGLGKVCESARIFLNNKELIGLIGPDFHVVISRSLLKAENTLKIQISNLMANRIAYLDRSKVEWKKFYNTNFPSRLPQNRKDGLFNASSWEPKESGLIGPVTLTAAEKMK